MADKVGSIKYDASIDTGDVKRKAKELEDSIKDSTDKSNKHLDGFAKKAGQATAKAAKAIGAGMLAATAAFTAFSGKVLMANAELEQQLGGAEAVFGEYANGIKETAKTAFKDAGLSQAEFLQGANKMGSLYQGSGIEVKKSMEMSATAMQRAADVASIMGIDTTFALESVAGMAKGNFTMMDNLGVAMNDTALNAYALEKGLGKTTAQMSMGEKVGLAYQLFMEKTAKYAGNYAKENDTLSGSLNTTKKAFSDFFTGTLPVTELLRQVGETAKIAGDNFVILAQSMGQDIFNALPLEFQEIINKAVELGTQVWEYLSPKLVDLWNTITTKLIPALQTFWKSYIEPLLPVLGVALVAAIGLVVDGLNLITDALAWVIDGINTGNPIIWGLIGVFGVLAGASAIGAVTTAMGIVTTVAIPGLIAKFGVLAAVIGAPIVMPAIIIGAAIASLTAVLNKANETRAAIDNAMNAASAEAQSSISMMQSARARYDAGEITYEQMRGIVGIAARAGGGSVRSGMPYFVGENPDGSLNSTSELFVPKTSGYIVNSSDLQGALSGGMSRTVTIGNIYLASDVDADRFLRKLNSDQEAISSGLIPKRSFA